MSDTTKRMPDDWQSPVLLPAYLAKLAATDVLGLAHDVDYAPFCAEDDGATYDHLANRVLPVLRELTRRLATHQEAKGDDK